MSGFVQYIRISVLWIKGWDRSLGPTNMTSMESAPGKRCFGASYLGMFSLGGQGKTPCTSPDQMYHPQLSFIAHTLLLSVFLFEFALKPATIIEEHRFD